jgi:RHS repeat-associated protein
MEAAGGVGGLLWVTLHPGSGAGAGTHFCAYDGNGNVVALASALDGSPTAGYEYGPSGEPIRITGPAATLNPFRFSTKRADNTTDLVLYECRAYQPSTGRWPNRDPLGETGGRNLYAFVGNSPVNFVDPFGLERIELWFAAFISPRKIRFPYYSNPNAFWHGDDRGFNPGTRPMSSRVWHWVVVETDPSKKPVVANISGTGLTTVTTYTVFGKRPGLVLLIRPL